MSSIPSLYPALCNCNHEIIWRLLKFISISYWYRDWCPTRILEQGNFPSSITITCRSAVIANSSSFAYCLIYHLGSFPPSPWDTRIGDYCQVHQDGHSYFCQFTATKCRVSHELFGILEWSILFLLGSIKNPINVHINGGFRPLIFYWDTGT